MLLLGNGFRLAGFLAVKHGGLGGLTATSLIPVVLYVSQERVNGLPGRSGTFTREFLHARRIAQFDLPVGIFNDLFAL